MAKRDLLWVSKLCKDQGVVEGGGKVKEEGEGGRRPVSKAIN